MNTLTFMVSGNRLKLVSGYTPVSGEKGYSKLKFIFDEEWAEVESILVSQYFDAEAAPEPVHTTIKDGVAVCDIHEGLRNQSGILHIGIMGAIADGSGVTIDTNITHVAVGEGARVKGTESTRLIQDLIEYLASIESNLLTKGNQVGTDNIKDVAVTSDKIAKGAVKGRHIEELSIGTDQIMKGAVSSSKIADEAIESRHIEVAAVTGDKIAPGAVTSGKLGQYAVTTGKIADDAVTEEKIADNSVDYNHLKDKAVTPEKLDREYVRLHPLGSLAVRSESMFHNYLVTGVKNETDDIEKFKMLSTFSIGVSISGILSVLRTGRYYGFYVTKSAFAFTSLGVNPKSYLAIFTDEKITSVERVDLKTFSELGDLPLDTDGAVDGKSIERRIRYLCDKVKNDVLEEIPEAGAVDVNIHAAYFSMSDTGEIWLKPEYRGASTDMNFPGSISNMGAGVVGSKNQQLPAELVIPELVDGVVVDRLTPGMFLDNQVVESLTFPDTVDEVPNQCCNQAVNLRHIHNTEHIKMIGEKAFRYTRIEKAFFPSLEEFTGNLTFSTVPHLIFADVGYAKSIPERTFKHCFSLGKVAGRDVTTVGEQAFTNTPRLRNVPFAKNLVDVDDYAFWRTRFDFDWDSIECDFSQNATYAHINPNDFWSSAKPITRENPTPTELCQRDPRWKDRQYGVDSNPDGYTQTYEHGCLQLAAMHAYCGIHHLKYSSVEEFEDVILGLTNPDENVVVNGKTYPNYLSAQNGTFPNVIAMLQALGIKVDYYNNDTWDEDVLKAVYTTIGAGGYVILDLDVPSGHGVVLYGINEHNELMVLDSEMYFPYDWSKANRYTLPINKLAAPSCNFITLHLGNLVTFYLKETSGVPDGVLKMQYYAAGDEIVMPDDPVQVGYDFAGWNMTAEEIAQAVANGADVTVLATWTKQIIKVNVTVNGGSGTGIYDANYSVTVTANEAPEGKKFAYWTDGEGNIRSYLETYKFYPSADTTLTAVFVAEDEEVEEMVIVSVDTVVTSTTDYIFYFSWYIPKEYTDIQTGIVAVSANNYNEATFYAKSTDPNVYTRPKTLNTEYANSQTWTKTNVPDGECWYARAFAIYTDTDGVTHTVYSDTYEAGRELFER